MPGVSRCRALSLAELHADDEHEAGQRDLGLGVFSTQPRTTRRADSPQRYHFVPIHGGWDGIVFPPQAGVIIYVAQSRITSAATIAGLIKVAVKAASAAAKLVTAQATLVSSYSRGYL